MTDKQIIIDECDVSKCKYFSKHQKIVRNNECIVDIQNACVEEIETKPCWQEHNCYFKDWQRKEQECEELKEEFKLFQQLKDEDSFRIAELSTENVKLKHQLDLYKNTHKTEQNRRRAFEQALAEIKEIAKKLKNFYEELGKCEDLTVVRLKQILQKINEVEDE